MSNTNTPSVQQVDAPRRADSSADQSAVRGGTERRAVAHQARAAKRAPVSLVTRGGPVFGSYRPTGVKVDYADNKVGVMPNLSAVLEKIAESAGVDLADSDAANQFLEAIVTDVYVNPYSDKQAFDGEIVVGTYRLPRSHIKAVLQPLIGTMYRRFARAMAPLVVEVMHDNYEVFGEILDKRASELGLSTRADAVRAFDGADALVGTDRATAQRIAEAKNLALSYRASPQAYTVDTSAHAVGARVSTPQ